jgi:site-specific DNA-methyltransferase (adenine-specific)
MPDATSIEWPRAPDGRPRAARNPLPDTDRWQVLHGDARAVLATLPTASADALVTDPPAGIGFMEAAWDRYDRRRFVAWLAEVLAECRRVLKPGAHALVWALPRTAHWTATALEEAGFAVRDVIVHLFGQGFPKSLDLARAIEHQLGDGDAARRWAGWGTALKPAAEHWILARSPLAEATVAANVLAWGTGALHVDACRVPVADAAFRANCSGDRGHADDRTRRLAFQHGGGHANDRGRWPANVVLSCCCDGDGRHEAGCAVRLLDEQSGPRRSGFAAVLHRHTPKGWSGGDLGGASRFFYVAKADRAEREAGLDERATAVVQHYRQTRNNGSGGLRNGDGRVSPTRNPHPTVKPIALMRWLCRLITPRDGLVLDPFAGTGTTGCAAILEGFRFLGVEQDAEYAEIARRRIAHWAGDTLPLWQAPQEVPHGP